MVLSQLLKRKGEDKSMTHKKSTSDTSIKEKYAHLKGITPEELISMHSGREGFLDFSEVESFVDKETEPIIFEHKETSKRVKFYPMIHIAPAYFYAKRTRELMQDLEEDYFIHYEGVKQSKKSKAFDLNYSKIAESLNLSEDYITRYLALNFPEKSMNSDLTFDELSLKTRLLLKNIVSNGMKLLSALINAEDGDLRDHISKDILNLYRGNSNKKEKSKVGKALSLAFNKEVLDKRNQRAVADIISSEKEKISILYGKGHLEGMRELLEEAGYTVLSEGI